MNLIIITGTPGVGKSTLAKKLAKVLKWRRLDIHDHYKAISSGYNQARQCYDIDLKKFEELVRKELKKGRLIVDSHIAHLLPKKLVGLCIVVTCLDIKKLERRLKKRRYSQKKIRENLDAEIFQICLNEAQERGHKVVVVKDGKVDGKVEKLMERLMGKG